jgi:hypothetical protein
VIDLSPITTFKGLAGVMAWMSANGLALGDVEIVQQDEFTLDFVVPLPDGRAAVFGIT